MRMDDYRQQQEQEEEEVWLILNCHNYYQTFDATLKQLKANKAKSRDIPPKKTEDKFV